MNDDDLGAFGTIPMTKTLQGSKLEDTENGSRIQWRFKGAMLGLTGTTMKDAPTTISSSNTLQDRKRLKYSLVSYGLCF
jgi:hypothetical protein